MESVFIDLYWLKMFLKQKVTLTTPLVGYNTFFTILIISSVLIIF